MNSGKSAKLATEKTEPLGYSENRQANGDRTSSANREGSGQGRDGTRRALVVGAVGRLGEAILNQVLARGQYREVVVVGTGRLTSTIVQLRIADINQLERIDDAYLILAPENSGSARSFHARDARFDALTLATLHETAGKIAAAGTKRLLLIAPMPAWQQVMHAPRGLLNELEHDLARMSFESVVILRPAIQATTSAGSLLQRFTQAYLQVQMFMLPRSIPSLTSDQIGRAAVAHLHASVPGLKVLIASDLTTADNLATLK